MSLSKPSIDFPCFPIIYKWIEHDYKKIETPEQMVAFIHKGLNTIEETQNEIKKICYKNILFPLISMQTGQSFESKLLLD